MTDEATKAAEEYRDRLQLVPGHLPEVHNIEAAAHAGRKFGRYEGFLAGFEAGRAARDEAIAAEAYQASWDHTTDGEIYPFAKWWAQRKGK